MKYLKWAKRIQSIFASLARFMLLPLLNILISKYLVVWKGETFWGEFCGVFLYVNLFIHIAGYGNREFLLRETSQNASNSLYVWQENLLNRSILLIPMIIFFLCSQGDFFQKIILIAWTIAAFLLQSFDFWVVYQKKILQNVWIELLGFLVLLAGIYWQKQNISLSLLYDLYLLSTCLKLLAFVFFFRKKVFHFSHKLLFRFDFHFQKGIHFFLLGFAGMLVSRADIYTLKLLVEPKELARYQIFSNLYLQTQAFIGLIILPFTANVYRLSEHQIRKMCVQLFLLGIAAMTFFSFAIYALIQYYYQLFFSWDYYLLAAISCLPIYAFTLLIYHFYKIKKERIVLLSQLIAGFVVFAITYLACPTLGIKSALFANIIAQWGLCIFYFAYSKRALVA